MQQPTRRKRTAPSTFILRLLKGMQIRFLTYARQCRPGYRPFFRSQKAVCPKCDGCVMVKSVKSIAWVILRMLPALNVEAAFLISLPGFRQHEDSWLLCCIQVKLWEFEMMIIKKSIALAVLSFYSLVRHLMCMSTFLLQPYPASDVFEYSAFVSGDACGAQSGYFLYSCKKVLDVCIFMLLYIPAFSMRICDGAGTAENPQHCQGGHAHLRWRGGTRRKVGGYKECKQKVRYKAISFVRWVCGKAALKNCLIKIKKLNPKD